MDFFKSVFADEPSSAEPSSDPDDDPQHKHQNDNDDDSSNDNNKAWSFGGLIKTLATKSESVIQNYRRDLEEFGSELQRETAVIRVAASRAVKDLPTSLEAGATVAQESLESVGQAIDDIGTTVWKSTAEIISHGRETLLAVDDDDNNDSDSDYALENNRNSSYDTQLSGGDSKPYNRFEAQVRAIQSNASTYLEEPEDLEGYEQWRLGFLLDDRREEIENLIEGNGDMGEIYRTLVPDKIENESFWLRYFYRVHKLKEVEAARAKLVKRAISGEEEDLSWDFDDDDHEDEAKGNSNVEIADHKGKDKLTSTTTTTVGVCDNGDNSEEASRSEGKGSDHSSDSCKDSDVSIVSKPEEEDDIGWDEIEDIGSNDEIKAAMDSVGSSNRADLHKRLSNAAEEDGDLSWDVEDDDDDDDGDGDAPRKS
ncbi:BSD domain containing protein [Trema orientale]|uniref:BSD domain containing protein n=1 Tax=Trema orientale TaxID=63057 RepID=A0A2P5FWZ2_TREOI|nr:BSD domain containing protein [Trema orientale]